MKQKDIKKYISDMKRQYRQICPKWIYFFTFDLFEEYIKLRKKIRKLRKINAKQH